MSMSDCPKCWDTPCTCGYGYRKWTEEALRDQIRMLSDVLKEKIESKNVPKRVTGMKDDALNRALAEYFEPNPVLFIWNDSLDHPEKVSAGGCWCYTAVGPTKPMDFINTPTLTLRMLKTPIKWKCSHDPACADLHEDTLQVEGGRVGICQIDDFDGGGEWKFFSDEDPLERAIAVSFAKGVGVWHEG